MCQHSDSTPTNIYISTNDRVFAEFKHTGLKSVGGKVLDITIAVLLQDLEDGLHVGVDNILRDAQGDLLERLGNVETHVRDSVLGHREDDWQNHVCQRVNVHNVNEEL